MSIENPGGIVSPYVAKHARPSAPGESALDVPCGRGRHTFHLAGLGYEVTAIDNDPRQIAEVEHGLGARGLNIKTVLGDANAALSVPPNSFHLMVTTHFVSDALILQLPRLLIPGGLFIYETFGAYGQNWRGLPLIGAMREQLRSRFDLLDYRERSAGPRSA